jgi:hypothetical protein
MSEDDVLFGYRLQPVPWRDGSASLPREFSAYGSGSNARGRHAKRIRRTGRSLSSARARNPA